MRRTQEYFGFRCGWCQGGIASGTEEDFGGRVMRRVVVPRTASDIVYCVQHQATSVADDTRHRHSQKTPVIVSRGRRTPSRMLAYKVLRRAPHLRAADCGQAAKMASSPVADVILSSRRARRPLQSSSAPSSPIVERDVLSNRGQQPPPTADDIPLQSSRATICYPMVFCKHGFDSLLATPAAPLVDAPALRVLVGKD